MTTTTLDVFLTPCPKEVQVKVVTVEHRGSLVRGFQIIRPTDKELKSIVGLDHDDYRDAYAKMMKDLNGFKMGPNAPAWSFWHRFHDRVKIRDVVD